MLAPERRTRNDILAVAVIAVAVLVAGSAAWITGDARGTTSVPASEPLPRVDPADSVPSALSELWRADSAATDASRTPMPVVTDSSVVTGDAGSVVGRDPRTGSESWSYTRTLPLCSVVAAWNTAVSVYRDGRGCSQVTELDGSTGTRKAQRSSDADDSVHLSSDGNYVTSRGDTRMELWRSDLVRTLEYGRVDAPVNAGSQPRTGCTLLSSVGSTTRVAVLELCPGEPGARLSLVDPAPKDASEPQEYGSTVVPQLVTGSDATTGARLLAATGNVVALYIPPANGNRARVAIYDDTASPVSEFDIAPDLDPAHLEPDEGDARTTAAEAGSVFTWFSGAGLLAMNSNDLGPAWSMPDALGAGAVMAGRLLVPIRDGVAVVDPATGRTVADIAVDRGDYEGAITTSVVGDVLVEQRGPVVVALG